MLVLQLLSEKPRYGYELSAELGRRSNGTFALAQGTLYPLLYSMEAKKLIRVAREEEAPGSGRRRRYYEVTPAGRRELKSRLETWTEVTRGVRLALGGA